jgi:subtilase family serine protease
VTAISTKQIKNEPQGIVWIKAVIKNAGKAKAAATVTEFRINGTRLGTVDTSALKAGASVTVKIRWDVRKLNGNYTISVRADYNGKVPESNENNNVSTLAVTVRKKVVTDGKFGHT